jgi:hypothetical protein
VDDEENELVKLTRTTIEPMKSTNEGEDSEWIDWRDRPNFADLSIRQYIENDDNNEEENRVTKEPTKTWKNKVA